MPLLSVLDQATRNAFPQQRIQATIEELLDASFYMQPVPQQRESMRLYVYSSIVARLQPDKDVPGTRKNLLYRFLRGPCLIKGK
jgi:hypothetical protein